MSGRIVLCATALLLLLVGCEKPTEEECTRICWKAGELAFWKQIEDKLAKEDDPDEKQVIREEAEEQWAEIKSQPMNPELTRCLLTCQKSGKPKQVKCIDEAKDYPTVQKCMEM